MSKDNLWKREDKLITTANSKPESRLETPFSGILGNNEGFKVFYWFIEQISLQTDDFFRLGFVDTTHFITACSKRM